MSGRRSPLVRVALASALAAALAPCALSPSSSWPLGLGAEKCFGKSPTIVGTGDDYRVVGTRHSDVIVVGPGNDVRGRGGDDWICGGRAHTSARASGGDGDDHIKMFGSITGGSGRDTLRLLASTDNAEACCMLGGPGDDVMYGVDVRFFPGPGDDVVVGKKGPDIFNGLDPGRTGQRVKVNVRRGVSVGQGRDIFSGINYFSGTRYADAFLGTPHRELISGGAGRDIIKGFGGPDLLEGEGGDDIARGGPGDDRLLGGVGNDVLVGGLHDDKLNAGNRFRQSPGSDALYGRAGSDTLRATDAVPDLINGGPGLDTCHVNPSQQIVSCQRPE